jgi:hypothetical protein
VHPPRVSPPAARRPLSLLPLWRLGRPAQRRCRGGRSCCRIVLAEMIRPPCPPDMATDCRGQSVPDHGSSFRHDARSCL